MKQINHLIKDYFGFSATELRGFWVLLLLASLSLIIMPFIKDFFAYSSSQPVAEDYGNIDSLIALLDDFEEKSHHTGKSNNNKIQHQRFDPNIAPKKLLVQNGIPNWLADRIIKFRSKGGKFRKSRDLMKIYGFSDKLYATLETYIVLPKADFTNRKGGVLQASLTKNKSVYRPSKAKKRKLEAFDINTADSVQLQSLPGVGRVLSSRIIRFRDNLGGIHSVDQFSEVYHISEEAIQNLKKYTYISADYQATKLNFNNNNLTILIQHPYISYSLAKAIVQHRENYGHFSSPADIKEVYLMNDSIFKKIAPYIGL